MFFSLSYGDFSGISLTEWEGLSLRRMKKYLDMIDRQRTAERKEAEKIKKGKKR